MGYDINFFKEQALSLPKANTDIFQVEGLKTLHYTHFSIIFSLKRKLPLCTAVNIDGKRFKAIVKSSDPWKYHPDIESKQLGDDFYVKTNQEFHRGHIVRRLDPCWGEDMAEVLQAEKDTFHFTNACPQHRKFNPLIWLELERNILEKGAVALDHKLTVFAGTVLSQLDKPYIKAINGERIFIPSHFWKVVVWKKSDNKVYAVGFIQSQADFILNLVDQGYGKEKIKSARDDYFQNLKFENDTVYQVTIEKIELMSGISFDFDSIEKPYQEEGDKELVENKEPTETRYKGAYKSDAGDIVNIEGLIL